MALVRSTRVVLIFSDFQMSEIIHNYAYTLFGYIMVLEKKLGDGRSLFTLEKKVFRENVFRCCVDEYNTQKWVRKSVVKTLFIHFVDLKFYNCWVLVL